MRMKTCPVKPGLIHLQRWKPTCLRKKTCLFLALFLLFPFIGAACGGGYSEDSPERAVDVVLTALKNLDAEAARKYYIHDETAGDQNVPHEFMDGLNTYESNRLLFARLDYKIISSSVEGDTATVKTEITNIDLGKVIKEYIQQAMFFALQNALGGEGAKSEEELNAEMEQLFLDLIQRKDNKTVTSTVDIQLNRDEDGWKINFNDELWDAVLGGLFSAFKSLEDNLQGLFPGFGAD